MLRFGISRIRLGYCVLLCIFKVLSGKSMRPSKFRRVRNHSVFTGNIRLLGSVRNLILKTNYSEFSAPETRATWNSLMIFK